MNNQNALAAALQWHIDMGADEALLEDPFDRTVATEVATPDPVISEISPIPQPMPEQDIGPLRGVSELRDEAVRLAKEAQTLEELRQAIADYEGLSIKKTSTNLVFSDGNPKAPIMVVGEAPGADEDRMGKPFVGVSGQLLDRILACIDIDRNEEDPAKSVYISNILNWRPPGNRTPNPAEIDLSLPFIERHIELINPKILIFAGGVSAKGLLNTESGISRLRGKFQDYKSLTLGGSQTIPALATYHPAYLLRTPSQKKLVWQDVLMVQAKRRELSLI